MPNNNSQKNTNNAIQKVIVNVNTTEPKKKPRRKPQPKEDVPIQQEQDVIRPTVQPALFPRRPTPYMPNVTQIHNNMPLPPYFQIPQTNQVMAQNNMRESFHNELHDLHHTLTRNASTQAELDHARVLVDQAAQAFEDELNPPQGIPQPQPIHNIPEAEMEDNVNNQVMLPQQEVPDVEMHIPDDVMNYIHNNAMNNVFPIPVNQVPPIVELPPSPHVQHHNNPFALPAQDNLQRLLEMPEPELEEQPLALPAPPPEVVGNAERANIESHREAFREGQRLFGLADDPAPSRQRNDARAQLKRLANEYGMFPTRYNRNLWDDLRQVINARMNNPDN
jgi:hypothetical protein